MGADTQPMTFHRHAWRAALSASVLAVSVPVLLIATTHRHDARPVPMAAGLGWLAVCVLVPLLSPRASRTGVVRFTAAATLWGVGTVLAAAHPAATLGPLSLPHLAQAASLGGFAVLAAQQLRAARVSGDDHPLAVEAALFATVGAALVWDVLARTGHTGEGWGRLTTSVVVLVSTFVAASALVLAVEHGALRRACAGLGVTALATQVAAVAGATSGATSSATSTGASTAADVAVVVAVAGGATLLLFQPRDGFARHGGACATRAAHRLRVAVVLPGVAMLADVAVQAVDPRADGVLFAHYGAAIVAAAVRQIATARAVDRTRRRLSSLAQHDQLTGLGNRTALADALVAPDRTHSLVLLQVGGLDDVTDVLGVTVGEDVLRAAAANLREHVTPRGGTAYRVRHDEFALLLPGGPEQAVQQLPHVLDAVAAAPLQVPGAGRFPVAALAGVARVEAGPRAAGDATLPLVHADLALRDARSNPGMLGWSVYSGAVAAQHARRLVVRERLAAAVADGGVDVHFQPIVDLATGRVAKFEALARWDDRELGRVSPVEFVAVAEESNLVVALGEHVLRCAVRSARAAGVFDAGVALAVNVSVVQLQSPGFADVVREILTEHRVPPHLLTLELTESVFLDSDSPAERVVTELARLGCRIAIDDFGTGYSAFGYLDRLPVHVLKIDRSLTQSLTGAGHGRSVVSAVVDLANTLGLTVVVEGVETDEEAAICRSLRAGLGQGWLYSAAVTGDRLGDELEREHPVEPVR